MTDATQESWFADNLGSGAVDARLNQLDPATARQVSAIMKDTFVHALGASLKLSTAVAAVGVVIALTTLGGARAHARAGVSPAVAPIAQRPD